MYHQKVVLAVLSIIGIALAAVPSYTIDMVTEKIGADLLANPVYGFDLFEDWMVLPVLNESDATYYYSISIRQRDPNGMYQEVGVINDHFSYAPVVNGEWIAVKNENGGGTFDLWYLYKMENNIPVLKQTVPGTGSFFYKSVGFFPGNVLVGEIFSKGKDNAWDIYLYDGMNWYLNSTLNVGMMQVAQPYDFSISRDRKFVVTANDTHIAVWQFQPNGPTFESIELFQYDNVNKYLYNQIIYNGRDTVVLLAGLSALNPATSYSAGVYTVYVKSNGQWSSVQTGGADDFGLRTPANMGTTAAFINEDSFVMTAYAENAIAVYNGETGDAGKCVVVSRGNDGTWTQTYQLEVAPGNNVSFGFNAVLNSRNELLVPGFGQGYPAYGFMYSTCLTVPFNATCNDMTVDDCDAIPFSDLYTVTSRPGCGQVNVTMINMSEKVNNQITVDFKFMKPSAMDVMCSSVVTCPDPPVAPVASPVATPVKAPVSTKTSGSSIVELSATLLLAVSLAM